MEKFKREYGKTTLGDPSHPAPKASNSKIITLCRKTDFIDETVTFERCD